MEFKKIWFEEFGEEITIEDAEREGYRILNLFKVIYKKIPINADLLKNEE